MRRRQWFDWHSWVGVNLSLLLTFILATGTLACVSKEIDWLFVPEMRASASVAPEDLPWGAMLSNFEILFPEAKAQYIHAPDAPWLAPELIATSTDGQRFRVFFDPASGVVQGASNWFNWQRFLRQAHRHLMLPTTLGISIVGLTALPLLSSLVSSLYIYKRWWRGFFKPPVRQASETENPSIQNKLRRRFWGDLHRFVGVWSLWFVAVIAITGLWYLAERWGLRADYPSLPAPSAESTNVTEAHQIDLPLQRLPTDYPTLEIRSIRLDQQNARAIFQGQAEAWLVRDRANHVAYDLTTGALIDVRQGHTLNVHLRLSEAADPLHFGTFGGTATRFLWAVMGGLMTLLSGSGVYLYGTRLLSSRAHQPHLRGPLSTALGNMSLTWVAPSALLIGTCIILGALAALATT